MIAGIADIARDRNTKASTTKDTKEHKGRVASFAFRSHSDPRKSSNPKFLFSVSPCGVSDKPRFWLVGLGASVVRFAILLFEMAFKRPKRLYEDENTLYDYAVGALGRRMRTVAELKRLMRQRVPRDERGQLLVEMVILRLKDQKYLNDTNYAAAYAGFRRDNEKFGKRRVITDLKVKGVHADVIEKVVDEAYAAVNEEKLARAYLKRKRLNKPGNDKETARIFRGLIRAGFGVGVAIKVLKNWNVDDELLTALQEETEEN